MFPSRKSADIVKYSVEVNGQIESLLNRVYFHKKGNIDVAVIDLNATTDRTGGAFFINDTNSKESDFGIGERVIFLGYPLGIKTIADSLTAPLVKGALVSGIIKSSDIILLDGHNNRGFSGGPVIAFKNGDFYKQHAIGIMQHITLTLKQRVQKIRKMLFNSTRIRELSFVIPYDMQRK